MNLLKSPTCAMSLNGVGGDWLIPRAAWACEKKGRTEQKACPRQRASDVGASAGNNWSSQQPIFSGYC